MRPRALRVAGLLAALAAAGGAGMISYERAREQLAVIEACDATRREDWSLALRASEGRTGADETGRAAAECRCLALLATGAGEQCVALLESVLSDPAADGWAPEPRLAVHLIQTWRERGRALEAAGLAQRAARRHPGDADLFYLELVTRSSVENETALLREMQERVAARGPAAARMRVSLAARHLLRGDPPGALRALGDSPPDGAGPQRGRWFETRGMALAAADDLAGVRRSYEAWRRAGGDPDELLARYALTLSLNQLADPERTPLELLRAGLAASAAVDDAQLQEALTIRLILTLVDADRVDEALAVFDRGKQRFALAGLVREELGRSREEARLAAAAPEARRGRLEFAIPAPEPGAALWLSPTSDAPLDADYERRAVPASGRVTAEREAGVAPLRWVYRDARGRTLASGTARPRPGESVRVAVAPGAPRAPDPVELHRRPADGRRRAVVLLLDCADWRLIQYLRARGELPVMDALLREGHRAELDSDPPLTAAALESLVWPGRRSDASFVGLVHQLGVELAGLASIGENPFSALEWLLPEGEDFFETLGAGRYAAANLLLAHGGIRAGRHGLITGPHGRRRRLPLDRGARDLDADERARWPALARLREPRDRVHVQTIAAEFDTAEALVRDGEVDVVLLRIEPLDILTHAHFAETVRVGQDDGERLLFSIYRYVDARVGDVHEQVDADDLFVVMSDHGIRTALEHSRHAVFVATGPDVPAGRAPGRPSLRGVPRALADWMGVETDWPDSGVAPWIRARAGALAPGAATTDPPLPLAAR